MPLTKVRRPKFERQDIKQFMFSSFLSCQRLHKIQRLLKLHKIDGFLVIIGIDGRFNPGAHELFNYLFFDVFAIRQDDIDRSKLDYDVFDDVMVCIRLDEVDVYCNGANYWLLLPYMAFWPGLRLHSLSEIEMEDPEKLEKFKMEIFAEITSQCNKIGVATKSSQDSESDEPFDPMLLETWPIVQSYAYDDFGRYSHENSKKGFFTLNHQVIDLSSSIHQIIKEVDPIHLENFYQKVLPQMEGLFENIFQLLDSKCSDDNFEINEKVIEEPVISYYNHLKSSKVSINKSVEMYPLVLCGKNTRQSILLDKMSNFTETESPHRKTLISNPKHMVIASVSLHTGIVIARTVFLRGSSNVFKKNSEIEMAYSDGMKLLSAYNAIISTVDFVIEKIKSSKNIELDETEAENQLKIFLQKVRYGCCSFKISQIGQVNDSHGFIVVLQGVVFDVVNEVRGENLGSVIFADSFVVTTTPLNKEDKINAVLRLGKRVPIFSSSTNTNISKLHHSMKDIYQLDPLCSEMVDIITANIYFQETIIQQFCCIFYADCFLLFNRRYGAYILYPESVTMFEGESYEDWTILSINCLNDKSKNLNWIWNNSDEKTVLHMVFSNNSKLRKSLTNIVIPKWKERFRIRNTDDIECQFLSTSWKFIQQWMGSDRLLPTSSSSQSIIDGISEDVHQSQMLKAYNSMNFSMVNRKSCIRTYARLMILNYSLRFFKHINYFEDLSHKYYEVFENFLQCWQPHSIFCSTKLSQIKKLSPEVKSKTSIVVTILCGLPGSGQEFLSRKITKIIHDNVFWILINPVSLNEVRSLTETMLKKFDNLVEKEGNNFRILLFAPALCLPNEIVMELENVASKLPIVIGSICVCLNPETAFMDNKECTLPGVLEMCNEGWVNTIILTGPDTRSIKTSDLNRLLNSRNNLCTLFLTPKADVTKELDTLLSKTSFQQERFALARVLYNLPPKQLNFGVENFRQISNRFYEIFYNLYGPLLKENIFKTMRDIFKSLKPAPYEKNIYFIEGVITIEEDPQNLFSLTAVSLTKQLTIFPLKNQEYHGDDTKSSNTKLQFIRIYVTCEEAINVQHSEQMFKLKDHFLSILTKFQRQIPERKRRLNKSDLNESQIAEIHEKQHLSTLPEGWFYNGITYVHMDGSRSDKHPDLSLFIDKYLASENLEIEKINAKIDTIKLKDAFVKP